MAQQLQQGQRELPGGLLPHFHFRRTRVLAVLGDGQGHFLCWEGGPRQPGRAAGGKGEAAAPAGGDLGPDNSSLAEGPWASAFLSQSLYFLVRNACRPDPSRPVQTTTAVWKACPLGQASAGSFYPFVSMILGSPHSSSRRRDHHGQGGEASCPGGTLTWRGEQGKTGGRRRGRQHDGVRRGPFPQGPSLSPFSPPWAL